MSDRELLREYLGWWRILETSQWGNEDIEGDPTQSGSRADAAKRTAGTAARPGEEDTAFARLQTNMRPSTSSARCCRHSCQAFPFLQRARRSRHHRRPGPASTQRCHPCLRCRRWRRRCCRRRCHRSHFRPRRCSRPSPMSLRRRQRCLPRVGRMELDRRFDGPRPAFNPSSRAAPSSRRGGLVNGLRCLEHRAKRSVHGLRVRERVGHVGG